MIVLRASTVVGTARESIWFPHRAARSVMEEEVKMHEVERPVGLLMIELLGCHEVLEVLVICPDFHWALCIFKKVSPLF